MILSAKYTYSPTCQINLPNNIFNNQIGSIYLNNTYTIINFAVDIQLENYNEGDTYSFSYKAWYSTSANVQRLLNVFGLY